MKKDALFWGFYVTVFLVGFTTGYGLGVVA